MIAGLVLALAFTLPSGDRVACVDADRHAALPPSVDPRAEERVRRLFGIDETRQCPAGTIPHLEGRVRGATRETPTARSLSTSAAPHEWAVAYTHVENRGGRATFNVWNPFVEEPSEFSVAQLWLLGGSQTVEAGWQVFPDLYGDNRTRLFVYSTSNNYADGCYNLDCKRFVQTSNAVILGAPLACTSVEDGPQCEVTLEYSRSGQGDWWLSVDGVPIGYYPAALFGTPGLGQMATSFEVGGEIVNTSTLGVHTTTGMGSGRAASEGYRRAAYIRNIQYQDLGWNYRDASLETTPPNATQSVVLTPFWGNASIFFGGPGRPLSDTALRSASTSTATTTPQSTLSIAFSIDATMEDNVIVGAYLTGPSEACLSADDRTAALTAGTNAVVRTFTVPASVAPGAYGLAASIWRDLNRNGVIDKNDQLLGHVSYPNAITVAPVRKRASH